MTPGDVIYIEANSGAVKRVGRSDAFATEFDLEAEEYAARNSDAAQLLRSCAIVARNSARAIFSGAPRR